MMSDLHDGADAGTHAHTILVTKVEPVATSEHEGYVASIVERDVVGTIEHHVTAATGLNPDEAIDLARILGEKLLRAHGAADRVPELSAREPEFVAPSARVERFRDLARRNALAPSDREPFVRASVAEAFGIFDGALAETVARIRADGRDPGDDLGEFRQAWHTTERPRVEAAAGEAFDDLLREQDRRVKDLLIEHRHPERLPGRVSMSRTLIAPSSPRA